MLKITQNPHPVFLREVLYPRFEFKRNPSAKTPLQFPKFEITASSFMKDDDQALFIGINVKSKDKRKSTALSFDVLCMAVYECTDTENFKEILNQFSTLDSPYTILWAYVREFMSRTIGQTGLPEFYLPLVIGWVIEEGSAQGRVDDPKEVNFLRQR
ncbi:hypothetical protein E7T06_07360 [Deinococcus sp. Arct2-2]|uniref:hypothetical protein n=1 Tax=Deinococcus sp. Arct2-2 TaxID=2568653 RepID=UPI0010A55D1E|nr:hypothetical protein [Deinococcus sp. Arct2-2]THF70515.1 hypothetical protein E7T06_07360 [Deinococcus sp. Arct2-2]